MFKFKTSDGKRIKTSDTLFFNSASMGAINTFIAVDESAILRTVPEDFIGHSTSHNLMCGLLTLDSANSKLSTLLTNLGKSRLRIGGSSTSLWVPDAANSTCMTPNWSDSVYNRIMIDNIVSFVRKIGYKLVFEVNTLANDPTTYADEAYYVYSQAGEYLYAIACGNEPDISSSYSSYSQYKAVWDAYRAAIVSLNPAIPLEGLENSYELDWLQSFITDEHTKVRYITQHYYPLAYSGTGWSTPTLANLMSETTIQKTIDYYKQCLVYTDAVGISLADGESNSVSHGGMPGVSNTMGAALWAIDHCFSMLELGLLYVNFHGLCGENSYSVIDDNCNILPMYYAMLFFHQAATDGNCVKNFKVSYLNVKSYSVITSDNNLRVAILNKEFTNDAYVQIATDGTRNTATVIYLDAPSAYSTSGLTFGGNAVSDDDGTWSAGAAITVPVTGGVAKLTVPAATAALITFS